MVDLVEAIATGAALVSVVQHDVEIERRVWIATG
jgi:hypothetical protein